MLRGMWHSFLDILFPPQCPVCRTAVEIHGAWCNACYRQAWLPRSISPVSHGLKALDSCYALCDYTAGVQRLIRDMKFRRISRLGFHMSWLVQHTPVDYFERTELVVPVPLSPERLKDRGFNQTELIFRPWAEFRRLAWTEALGRRKATLPQWELRLQERRANIKGAFVITRPEDIVGKHILLVDDIFTTGLTMDECAKVLKKAGAQHVTGLAVASGAW